MSAAERFKLLKAAMDETELVSLESTLDGMETQEEQPKEEKRNPMLEKPDAAGRTKVDLSKMFDDPNKKPENPDPRQEKIDAIEGRRGERIGYVKQISDANYSYLTGEQKAMLAQKNWPWEMPFRVSSIWIFSRLENKPSWA